MEKNEIWRSETAENNYNRSITKWWGVIEYIEMLNKKIRSECGHCSEFKGKCGDCPLSVATICYCNDSRPSLYWKMAQAVDSLYKDANKMLDAIVTSKPALRKVATKQTVFYHVGQRFIAPLNEPVYVAPEEIKEIMEIKGKEYILAGMGFDSYEDDSPYPIRIIGMLDPLTGRLYNDARRKVNDLNKITEGEISYFINEGFTLKKEAENGQ
jgi:hypothetical protein